VIRRAAGFAWVLLAVALAARVASADIVDADRLADPAQEARAQSIMRELRCLVCQNESIAESNADLAGDLRHIVRQRIEAGDSDAQIRAFMVARFGDWILLKPPFKPLTYALWIAPFAFVAFGGLGILLYFRRRGGDGDPGPLNEAEQAELDELLKDGTRR
jgi:cytochrome c-type biogenesis protein CcmH